MESEIIKDIDNVMNHAWNAFHEYRKLPLKKRADFMRAIAVALEQAGDELLEIAASETNLPLARLRNERTRTAFQLTSYADACERGNWLEASIDAKHDENNKPLPGLRKMQVPLGPVVVFGASNFPFAYSTAGGDTACAFAAGCPVIVKAHPAHSKTSDEVAEIILQTARTHNLPGGIFAHVHGGNETGKQLVQHPYTKAVGFTGSFEGGMALYNYANQRKDPIPVFAEMGSVNPVFILPGKLKEVADELAKNMAASITLGSGQFCTNPGLMIALKSEELDRFMSSLGEEIRQTKPETMLHPGIYNSFVEKRETALSQSNVETIAVAKQKPLENQGTPTIAMVDASAFIQNNFLHKEVFGPYSLMIQCNNMEQMYEVALSIEGQLTASVMATDNDLNENDVLIESIKNICGRLILNGVPTGVEVCQAMHHGGPFPATTDSRFTSVGADGIKRFSRPICFQNWSNDYLPDELKNENPLNIYRTVNNVLTKDPLI